MLWDTVSPIELLWLVKCVASAVANGVMLRRCVWDRQARRNRGLNGALAMQATHNVWKYRILLAAQVLGVLVVIPSLLLLPRQDVEATTVAWVAGTLSPILLLVTFALFDALTTIGWMNRTKQDDYFRMQALRDEVEAVRVGREYGKRRTDQKGSMTW